MIADGVLTDEGVGAGSSDSRGVCVSCEWNETTCSEAAYGGHLEVLQWARANGCEWNALTCSYAAQGGHLGMLQWARASGCPDNEDY